MWNKHASQALWLSNIRNKTSELWKLRVYHGVRICELFLCFAPFVFLGCFVLTSLFFLFYVTRELNRFLHRGWAKTSYLRLKVFKNHINKIAIGCLLLYFLCYLYLLLMLKAIIFKATMYVCGTNVGCCEFILFNQGDILQLTMVEGTHALVWSTWTMLQYSSPRVWNPKRENDQQSLY